jgi:ATP-binding cassette, subfamily B, bacterial IrtB/YbtQ
MIRQVLRILPPASARIVPRYLTQLVLLAIAQAAAFVLLAPALTALFSGDVAGTWPWVAGIAVAVAATAVLNYLQAMSGFSIGAGMMHDLEAELGDHVSLLPIGWFDRSDPARVSRTIVQDVREVMGVFAHLLAPLLLAVMVPVFVAVGMLAIDWRISVAMVVAAPILYLVHRWGSGLYARADARMHESMTEADARVIEFAQAQPTLRAFGAVGERNGMLRRALDVQGRALRGTVFAMVPGMLVFSFVLQLAFIGLVYLSVTLATGGEIAAAAAIALIAVSSRFVEPLTQATELGGAIRAASSAARRIHELRSTPTLAIGAAVAPPAGSDLRFEGVRFSYDGAHPVLDGIDLDAPQGTTTAIVGLSGAGKTTILRLASRFYDVDAGAVRLGGVDVRDLDPADVLARVSPVFQNVYLFDDTIEANIRMARPEATDEEVRRAGAMARVDEIVDRLPDGWRSRVGEGGASLSGGERQRVAIARALLKDAPVVLLDEATSALDPANEAAVTDGIRALTAGKTVLVVAHRLSTITHADQIVVVEDGRVVERGTHAELLARDGRYARFWNERSRAAGWRLEPDTTATGR